MTPERTRTGLRTGYTTGACAAAAAKAAALMLRNVKAPEEVSLLLPAGKWATFVVASAASDGHEAMCGVIKDAGDDPDVTNGAEIRATVRGTEDGGIAIDGGEGVGVVTKAGLELPVGSAAINPTPRKMIEAAVCEAAGSDSRGFHVTISVPGGEEIAKRTLNARLGVMGGISIIGTTGIVVPMSHSAYTSCISLALDVAVAAGCREAVLTTGRRTELFAMRMLDLPQESFVEMGDFVGFALDACRKRGFRRVTVAAMIGKMTKIAAGYMQTHADSAPQSLEGLIAIARETGANEGVAVELAAAGTAREVGEIITRAGLTDVFGRLCAEAHAACAARLGPKTGLRVLLCGFEGELWGHAGEKF